MNYYTVGKLLSTHGLKGDLKLQVISDFDRFYKGSKLYILYKDNYVEVKVSQSKPYKNGMLISFEGLNDINLIEKYKNCPLFIEEQDMGKLEDGYYFHELIGKQVFNELGESRGEVTSIEEVPQGYNLVIQYQNQIRKVPFIDNVFIKSVENDKIVIKEIEGLF